MINRESIIIRLQDSDARLLLELLEDHVEGLKRLARDLDLDGGSSVAEDIIHAQSLAFRIASLQKYKEAHKNG